MVSVVAGVVEWSAGPAACGNPARKVSTGGEAGLKPRGQSGELWEIGRTDCVFGRIRVDSDIDNSHDINELHPVKDIMTSNTQKEA